MQNDPAPTASAGAARDPVVAAHTAITKQANASTPNHGFHGSTNGTGPSARTRPDSASATAMPAASPPRRPATVIETSNHAAAITATAVDRATASRPSAPYTGSI